MDKIDRRYRRPEIQVDSGRDQIEDKLGWVGEEKTDGEMFVMFGWMDVCVNCQRERGEEEEVVGFFPVLVGSIVLVTF